MRSRAGTGGQILEEQVRVMKKVKLLFFLLLPGLASCSMFGGESADPLDELRTQIIETVLDAERADLMLASVDRLDKLLIESADILTDSAQKERELFRDYDSTPEDFRAVIAAASGERRRVQQALLDVHLSMKSNATAAEWDAISPVQVSVVASRVESLVNAARSGS
jgi:hypothetical protein